MAARPRPCDSLQMEWRPYPHLTPQASGFSIRRINSETWPHKGTRLQRALSRTRGRADDPLSVSTQTSDTRFDHGRNDSGSVKSTISNFVFFCLLLVSSSSAGETTKIRLRADLWMPYNGEPTAAQPGFAVELARAAFEPRGIAVDYGTLAWPEALRQVKSGAIDGVIGANAIECEGLVRPHQAIGLPRIGFFTRKDNPWRFTSVAALKDIRLGVIDSYSYFDTLDALIRNPNNKVIVYKGDGGLMRAIEDLELAKVDMVPETAAVFYWTVKESGRNSGAFHLAYLRQGEPIFIAFAATSEGKRLAEIFDVRVTELRTTGVFQALLEKYRLSDW